MPVLVVLTRGATRAPVVARGPGRAGPVPFRIDPAEAIARRRALPGRDARVERVPGRADRTDSSDRADRADSAVPRRRAGRPHGDPGGPRSTRRRLLRPTSPRTVLALRPRVRGLGARPGRCATSGPHRHGVRPVGSRGHTGRDTGAGAPGPRRARRAGRRSRTQRGQPARRVTLALCHGHGIDARSGRRLTSGGCPVCGCAERVGDEPLAAGRSGADLVGVPCDRGRRPRPPRRPDLAALTTTSPTVRRLRGPAMPPREVGRAEQRR